MFRGKGRRQKAEGRSIFARRCVLFLLLPSALCLLTSCKGRGPTLQQMATQPSYKPLAQSDFFGDGMAARPRVPGTVARGEVSMTGFLATGKINGQDGDGFPFPVTIQVMNRGEERYNIYCSECHGKVGDGNGMIPERGYRRPPSYHTDTLRAAKTGHFFDVITNGFGAMPSYAPQVPVTDRWAIIAYIRALQLSQHGAITDLPPDMQAKLSGGGR